MAMTIPDPRNWEDWTLPDYYAYFLSGWGARQRMAGRYFPLDRLDEAELVRFCAPIKAVLEAKYGAASPVISINMVGYNEQDEVLASLASFALLDTDGLGVELIVIDNNSRDRMREVVRACGAKYVLCTDQGTPFARAAGLAASSDTAEYLWMTDADIRVVPPQASAEAFSTLQGSFLKTAYGYMERHPKTVGISTGTVLEASHWSHRLLRWAALRAGKTRPYSCWGGANQFVRKQALIDSGGIRTDVLFGEDHVRHSQLANWAKAHGFHLSSANMNPEELADPVYHSGRRHGTLRRQLQHLSDTLRRRSKRGKDRFGLSLHKAQMDWRHVRRDADTPS